MSSTDNKKNKRFFAFNLLFSGTVLGFALALMSFSCTTRIPGAEDARAQEVMQEAVSIQGSFRSVAAEVLPVVVELKVTDISSGDEQGFDLFNPLGQNPDGQEHRNQGLGSGIIVQRDGRRVYVLTNNHVVEGSDSNSVEEVTVVLYDEREYEGKVVGRDPRKDLAMVVFETRDQDINIAKLGDSNALFVGDWVLAVGSPFGYVSSVTAGIVSAKGRRGPDQNINDFIQTDAAINQGNSGGALVNLNGEVVGINTWIATNNTFGSAAGNIGLAFAIPINNARRAIEDLIAEGEPRYGWLGISGNDILPIVAEGLGITERKGGFVNSVFGGSPADKAGLKPGDLVTYINGERIDDYLELTRIVGDLRVGDKAVFEVIRGGNKDVTVEVTIGLREDEAKLDEMYSQLWPGLLAIPLNDDIRKDMEVDGSVQGVVIAQVYGDAIADAAGLQINDIVTKINDTEVSDLTDFYAAVGESGRRFNFEILRQGEKIEIGMSR